MNKKRFLYCILSATIFLTACGKKEGFIADSKVTVISREDGSGTKDTFTNILKIYNLENGKKIDNTTIDSDIIQSTGAIISSVESNKYAIGYISYGVLNDNVKALAVDGVVANRDNIKNGTYKIARNFNVVVNNNNDKEVVKDFMAFISSKEGQAIVEKFKYISKENTGSYQSKNVSGKITISGSSSVAPIMEKLKEEYLKLNSNVVIEINQSDSTNGIENVVIGISDIGLSSRELTAEEKSNSINNNILAIDALVLIVNKENKVDNLTSEEIKNIYQGHLANWKDIVKEK